MDLNFDYREFQRDSMERLAKIYAESLNEENSLNECDKTFNKIQRILDCPEMEQCHPYLFTLDREHVNERDKEKVNKLYECGVKRGFINEDDDKTLQKECDVDCCDVDDCDSALCGGPEDSLADLPMKPQPVPQVETHPTFNVLYSAMKDGDVKMGEFYSLATSKEGAREECTNQLRSAGYSNITVMAIEQNTDAVDQNIEDIPAGANLYNMQEDDSEEYEKQETGDTSDNDTDDSTDKKDDNSTEKTPSEDNSTDDADTEDSKKQADEPSDDSESTEETPEENTEDSTDSKEEDKSEETTDDTEGDSDNEEEKKDDSEKEDTSDTEEPDEEEKKLTAEEKANLKDEYTKTFKQVLPKVSTSKSVSEMTIAEKTDFYTKLSEKWTKDDPSLFLTDKDQEKLNKFIAKPEEEEEAK